MRAARVQIGQLRRCKCGAGADVLSRQLREVAQEFLLAHAGSEVRQCVADRDSGSPNAWFPEPNFWIYHDRIAVIHTSDDRRGFGASKETLFRPIRPFG